MLDTNVVSHIVRGDRPELRHRVTSLSANDIVVSALTAAELRYGLAKLGHPHKLEERIRQFLHRVDVLPWDHEVAETYARFRVNCESMGLALAHVDMMIAAHAVAADATLVTRDKAFSRLPTPLKTDDWSPPSG